MEPQGVVKAPETSKMHDIHTNEMGDKQKRSLAKPRGKSYNSWQKTLMSKKGHQGHWKKLHPLTIFPPPPPKYFWQTPWERENRGQSYSGTPVKQTK